MGGLVRCRRLLTPPLLPTLPPCRAKTHRNIYATTNRANHLFPVLSCSTRPQPAPSPPPHTPLGRSPGPVDHHRGVPDLRPAGVAGPGLAFPPLQPMSTPAPLRGRRKEGTGVASHQVQITMQCGEVAEELLCTCGQGRGRGAPKTGPDGDSVQVHRSLTALEAPEPPGGSPLKGNSC